MKGSAVVRAYLEGKRVAPSEVLAACRRLGARLQAAMWARRKAARKRRGDGMRGGEVRVWICALCKREIQRFASLWHGQRICQPCREGMESGNRIVDLSAWRGK